jgi:hypothetical protein
MYTDLWTLPLKTDIRSEGELEMKTSMRPKQVRMCPCCLTLCNISQGASLTLQDVLIWQIFFCHPAYHIPTFCFFHGIFLCSLTSCTSHIGCFWLCCGMPLLLMQNIQQIPTLKAPYKDSKFTMITNCKILRTKIFVPLSRYKAYI